MVSRRTSNSFTTNLVLTIFIIVGLIFIAVGAFYGVKNANVDDGRIYTTATVVNVEVERVIDSYHTDHYTYKTYVEYEIEGETITARLNPSSDTDRIGDEVEIYYYLDNPTLVEVESGNTAFTIGFILIGSISVIVGIAVLILQLKARKKRDDSYNYTSM